MRQLTSLDAQFLALESPRTYGHVSGLAVYDPSTAPGGRIEREDICRVVAERLHLLPPFHWRLVQVPLGLDHPYWIEDPDFDLDFHIRDHAVPPPGNDRQLAETVARIVARPLDRSRPLWELYVIHGLPDGHVALLTKIHHAVVDGVSGAEILGILLDLEASGREIPPPERPIGGEREPSAVEMLARGAVGLPRQPLRAARSLPTTVPNLRDLPGVNAVPGAKLVGRVAARAASVVGAGRDADVLEAPGGTAPRTRFNGRISPHRRYSFGQLSLDRVKAVKDAAGVTVNDAVVCVCATALRSWLLERDELPGEPLVAMVPVSVRTQEQVGTFGNKVSAMFVPIPTDEPDPRRRLERTHETLAKAKSHHRALPATLMQDATQFIPPAVHALATRLVMRIGASGPVRPPLNLVISNVPGPRIPLYMGGAQLVAHYPVSAIAHGAGLNITCMSYLDHVDFGVVVDREQVDDAWPLMDGLRDALGELDEVICGKRRGGRRTRPAPVPG
jgi:diacylglycerol O-acyltransferase / wax synthase